MRVELVKIAALLAANIALPWITLAVAALVQKVQRLIRKRNAAVGALEAARARIGPGRSRRLASRIGIRDAAAVVAAVVVVGGGARGELAAQIVTQQRLQRRHFDQRRQRQVAGRRAAVVHAVAVRLLLDGYQGDRRRYGFVASADVPEKEENN